MGNFTIKNGIRLAVITAFLFFAAISYPHAATFPCENGQKLMKKTLMQGYAYLATGATDRGFAMQTYVNVRSLKWVILGVDENLNACVIMRGNDFKLAYGSLA